MLAPGRPRGWRRRQALRSTGGAGWVGAISALLITSCAGAAGPAAQPAEITRGDDAEAPAGPRAAYPAWPRWAEAPEGAAVELPSIGPPSQASAAVREAFEHVEAGRARAGAEALAPIVEGQVPADAATVGRARWALARALVELGLPQSALSFVDEGLQSGGPASAALPILERVLREVPIARPCTPA